MSKIIVLASFHPKKDRVKEVKEIILSMIKPTRSEEGNELYNFYEEKIQEKKMVIDNGILKFKLQKFWLKAEK